MRFILGLSIGFTLGYAAILLIDPKNKGSPKPNQMRKYLDRALDAS